MSLRWDPLLVRHLARELDGHLRGARTRALRLDGATRRLVLFLRTSTLRWNLHPSAGTPALDPAAEPAGSDLPLPGRVRAVRGVPDERVLVIEVLPDKGRPPRDLIVELLGNQWNALVVERPSDTVRHVLVTRGGARALRVGHPYAPPRPMGREGAEAPLPLDRWRELLDPVPPAARARTLVSSVAWTSPLNAPALVDGRPDPEAALLQGHALLRRLVTDEEPPAPAVLLLEGGGQPYPWPLPGVGSTAHGTLLEAFAAAAPPHRDEATADQVGISAEAFGRLDRVVEAEERRLTSLQAELDRLDDEDALRARGDLMLARLHDVPTGADSVTLRGFDGDEVTLRLDPTLAPHENARAFYDAAARVGRARERIPGLLAEGRARLETLRALRRAAERGEATEAAFAEVLPPPGAGPTSVDDEGASLPYRSYRSSGGLEIRVGRGARHNDDLTFHHSAPSDVWLHARYTAGAHVILRWGQPGNPPARDLHEAAVLAALHSKARTSGSVPVDWTLRKYVRKPRGAAPGSVVPDRVKTLLVRPDPALPERLEP